MTAPAITEFIILFAFIIPAILFLITQQKTLQLIQPSNRSMIPGMIWLQCIPFFGLIWQFVVVTKISDSIVKEFASWESSSGVPSPEIAKELSRRPTYEIGIAYCLIISIGFIMNFFSWPSYMKTGLAAWNLSGIICWIVYWFKLVQYKRKLNGKYL